MFKLKRQNTGEKITQQNKLETRRREWEKKGVAPET